MATLIDISATSSSVDEILSLRELYRQEMNCQIIHDSLHTRSGWTNPYLLRVDGVEAGYGSMAIGGPWNGKPTLFEFFVFPAFRTRVFDLFRVLLSVSGAEAIETQSNDSMLTTMLHTFSQSVKSESILFHDKVMTGHAIPGAVVRKKRDDDNEQIAQQQLDGDSSWVLELNGVIAATGGILMHYNRPYGDIYMKVGEAFRRRGIGAFVVQELKRICYERGDVPAARCRVDNEASRKTLQKAGFVPCGHILVGQLILPNS